MTYTLTQMRDNIRTSLDVDSTDISDSLIDIWLREGSQRVFRRLRRWPFMEKTTTFNTVAGTAGYLYTTIQAKCDAVVKVTGPNWDVRYVPIETAERVWPRNNASQGEPRAWSRWAKGITLWPTPNAIYSVQVRYYETMDDWVAVGAAGVPSQLPDEFSDLILQWGLMRAHAQQEDLDLSQAQKATFDELLETMKRAFEHEPTNQLMILGGTPSTFDQTAPGRLTYPFE